MAKPSTNSNSQPKPGADSNPASLQVSYGPEVVQPRGFKVGTVDVIGCMAGDWSVDAARDIAGAIGERASEPAFPKKKERY